MTKQPSISLLQTFRVIVAAGGLYALWFLLFVQVMASAVFALVTSAAAFLALSLAIHLIKRQHETHHSD